MIMWGDDTVDVVTDDGEHGEGDGGVGTDTYDVVDVSNAVYVYVADIVGVGNCVDTDVGRNLTGDVYTGGGAITGDAIE